MANLTSPLATRVAGERTLAKSGNGRTLSPVETVAVRGARVVRERFRSMQLAALPDLMDTIRRWWSRGETERAQRYWEQMHRYVVDVLAHDPATDPDWWLRRRHLCPLTDNWLAPQSGEGGQP